METIKVNDVDYYTKMDTDVGSEVRKCLETPGALKVFIMKENIQMIKNTLGFSNAASSAYEQHMAKMFLGDDAYFIVTEKLFELQAKFAVTVFEY